MSTISQEHIKQDYKDIKEHYDLAQFSQEFPHASMQMENALHPVMLKGEEFELAKLLRKRKEQLEHELKTNDYSSVPSVDYGIRLQLNAIDTLINELVDWR